MKHSSLHRRFIIALILYLLLNQLPGFAQTQHKITSVLHRFLSLEQLKAIAVGTRAGSGGNRIAQERAIQRRRSEPVVTLQTDLPASDPEIGDALPSNDNRGKPHLYTEIEAANLHPLWPNPLLALLPAEAKPDYNLWQTRMHAQAQRQAKSQFRKSAPRVNEIEPNNSQASATFLGNFGTGISDQAEQIVIGTLTPPPLPASVGPFAEDDGSIGSATILTLSSRNSVRFSGTIGDGLYGSSGQQKGDFDLVGIVATAGQTIVVDIDTPSPTEDLDSIVAIFAADGTLLTFNDDDPTGNSYDSYLEYTVSTDGTYYVAIAGFHTYPTDATSFLQDPFNSGSGPGAGSEGIYQATIGLDIPADVDYFSFELRAGDILGASVTGSTRLLEFYDPAGALMIGSSQDVTAVYPNLSPLPRGGNAVLSTVIPQEGRYAIAATKGSGPYELELTVHRPLLEQEEPQTVQTLFIDFDGAVLNPVIFGGPDELRSLSPLSAFMTRWGLSAADESALIDAILASVVENLATDIGGTFGSGRNGDYTVTGRAGEFAIRILNSRDHDDPFGQPHVSRIIVGGTIEESGLQTIGIAQSIDVGNFNTSESALVLLDLLSEPASNPNSLNRFGIDASRTKLELVGTGVGNIIAHEAGHFFGDWHTDNGNQSTPNLMDQGGNLPNTVGTGADNVFGTADDVDVDFGPDIYAAPEKFRGTEDTLQTIAFGLSSGAQGARLEVRQAVSPLIVTPGNPATISISITNHGPAIATNIVISDQVVSLLTDLSFIGDAVQQNTNAQKDYVWRLARLAKGETTTIVINGIVHPDLDTEGEFANIVTAMADQMDKNSQNRAEAIIKINLPPIVDAGGPYSVESGGTTKLSASATDPGGDQLTYAWDLNEDGVFDDATGPNPRFDAAEIDGPKVINISLRVRDEDGAVSTATTTILVTDASSTANAGGPYIVDEGGSIMLNDVSVGVAFSNELLYEWDLDDDGEFDDATDKAPVFDAANLDGPTTVKIAVRITDQSNDAVAIGTTTVTVQNVAPIASAGGSYSVAEGDFINLIGAATEISSKDTITYAWDFNEDGLFTDAIGRKPRFDAAGLNGPGTVSISLRVMDDDGGSTQSKATIEIINAPPIAQTDEISAVRAALVAIKVLENDSDPGADTLKITEVQTPTHGTAEIDGASVIYKSNAEFEGADSFDYTIDDGDGGQATATITVNVALPPEEQSPIAANDIVTTAQESAIIIPVLANDIEPTSSPMEVIEVGLPRNGTATTDGYTITYVPDINFIGSDTFIYTIANEYGKEAVAVILVKVIPGGDVTGVVFDDRNANGQQDADEAGVPNIILTLSTASVESSASAGSATLVTKSLTATTDPNGSYRFPLIPPGSYDLGMEAPVEARNRNIVVSMNASGAINVENPLAPVPPSKTGTRVFLPFVGK